MNKDARSSAIEEARDAVRDAEMDLTRAVGMLDSLEEEAPGVSALVTVTEDFLRGLRSRDELAEALRKAGGQVPVAVPA